MTTMECTLDMKAVVPPDVLIQETLGESVLLNLRSGQYFGLNSVGTHMWTVFTRADSLGAACNKLAAEYDVEPHRLEQDLRALVKQLTELGLLEVHGG
jgi:Coenzyme PQQ synthesis protein D (PqqD)